jgi:hypothetical protein
VNALLRALDGFWFVRAPATRPAVLRVLLGTYALYYLGRRYSMLMDIARSDPALFRPVGVVYHLRKPVPVAVFRGMLLATYAANAAFILGWRHRHTGPLFGGLLLWVLSYRNSWSMIFHNDNVLVMHALILGLTPSADALSLDGLSRDARRKGAAPGAGTVEHWRYGWPVRLMSAVTALTYFLAGVAKLKGPLGWRWASGEALRAQVAVDGLRKELLGEGASPMAHALYDKPALFGVMGFGSLVLELAAPAALLHRRLSRLWVANAFLMHWGIFAVMGIRFRYQMSGLIFASFFDVERLLDRASRWAAGKEGR